MTSNAGTALHLINLRTNDNDGNDEYWRNAAKQILPFDNTSVTYHLEDGEQVPGSIFAVGPDDERREKCSLAPCFPAGGPRARTPFERYENPALKHHGNR